MDNIGGLNVSEKNYTDALEKARDEFRKGDPGLMADCSGAAYKDLGNGNGVFTLSYLNKKYHITYPAGKISFAPEEQGKGEEIGNNSPTKVQQPWEKVGCGRPLPDQIVNTDYSGKTILISDQTLMLMYLKQASGLPAREQWVNFLQLPEGSHHYGPFMVDAINPMVDLFDGKQDLFLASLAEMGGQPVKMGDFGGLIPVLPKITLAAIIWVGDEEFPAKGNILFDVGISTYLDTAGAYVLGINTARRLVTIGISK